MTNLLFEDIQSTSENTLNLNYIVPLNWSIVPTKYISEIIIIQRLTFRVKKNNTEMHCLSPQILKHKELHWTCREYFKICWKFLKVVESGQKSSKVDKSSRKLSEVNENFWKMAKVVVYRWNFSKCVENHRKSSKFVKSWSFRSDDLNV